MSVGICWFCRQSVTWYSGRECMHPSVNLSSQIWHESRSLKAPPFPQIYLSLNYVRCLNLLVFLSVGDKIEWERNDSISSVHINSTQPSQKNKQTNNKCKQMQQTVHTNDKFPSTQWEKKNKTIKLPGWM